MAKLKSSASSAPAGTFVYFILKADGTPLTSYGAGTATLDSLLSTGWTALREAPLSNGRGLPRAEAVQRSHRQTLAGLG